MASALYALLLATAAAAAVGPVIQFDSGKVRGFVDGGARVFLGVPYAQAPVGRWRFMPPQPLRAWPGVRDGTKVGPGCLREASWYTLNPATSEDCLTLDIWTPVNPRVANMPVMVWIFGGGYHTGSGDSLQTRGNRLVQQYGDVVVITINYRLGALGWLGSAELRRQSDLLTGKNSTGNMGLLDMQAALQWVQRNAAALGGDNRNVMVFGESAGAGAVSALMGSKASRGLFHKAGMQSGGFQKWTAMSLNHSQHNYHALLAELRSHGKRPGVRPWHKRCQPGESDIDCLYRLPAAVLMRVAANSATAFMNSSGWDGYNQCQWGPIVDANVLLEHPFTALQRSRLAHPVPAIIGFNKDDGTEFMDGCPNDEDDYGNPSCNLTSRLYNRMNRVFASYRLSNSPGHRGFNNKLYREWLPANFPQADPDKLLQVYPGPSTPVNSTADRFNTNYWAAEYMMGDFIMYCTGRRAACKIANWAKLPSRLNDNVYQFYFTRTPNQAPFRQRKHPRKQYVTDGFRACHGCEIPFVFLRDDSLEYGISGQGEMALGRAMSTYWTNFAWNSNPSNATGRLAIAVKSTAQLPVWWGHHQEDDAAVVLDATETNFSITMARPHPRAKYCRAFWDKHFADEGWFL